MRGQKVLCVYSEILVDYRKEKGNGQQVAGSYTNSLSECQAPFSIYQQNFVDYITKKNQPPDVSEGR